MRFIYVLYYIYEHKIAVILHLIRYNDNNNNDNSSNHHRSHYNKSVTNE